MFDRNPDREDQGVVRQLFAGVFKLGIVAGAAVLLYPPFRKRAALTVHRKVERALSRALGASVSFGRLRVSPLDGSFEAHDLTLRRTPSAEPFCRVARVRGLVRLHDLLSGLLTIDALELDRPVISIVRYRGGSVSNLPPALEVGPLHLAHKAEQALEAAETGARAAHHLGLRARLGESTILDGTFRFRDESLDGYELVADGMACRSVPSATSQGAYEFHGMVRAVARRDQPADLGQIRFQGRLTNLGDLTRFPQASFQMDVTADGPQQMHARIDCPSIGSRRMHASIEADAELAALALLVPSQVEVLQPLRNSGTHGHVHVDATVTYDPQRGLQLPEFTQSAHDVVVGGTAMPSAPAVRQ